MTEANAFRIAKQLLDRYGWSNCGAVARPDKENVRDVGEVCMMVAVGLAEGLPSWRNWRLVSLRRKAMMINVIEEQFGEREFPSSFNDDDGRTREDIDMVLDKCAALEDEYVALGNW
jgi:hypothetical protein